MEKPNKVLIIGSGALKIGEAGEFDYSGSQALKALREEGIETVLINPNIATIQTSKGMADKVYFLPVTPNYVEEVIKKEMPEGILLAFGGQTALNCGVKLQEKGILKKYNIKVLGTPVSTIQDTEDRDLFIRKLNQIDVKSPKSVAISTVDEAIVAAENIGFPMMIRIAYALGGKGSGLCKTKEEMIRRVKEGLSSAPQILIEEWLGGWKEVEYEVVRDCYDNCITVCNMENFDPLGIHTGESIVVAPSQTLTSREYHKLREISIRVIRHLGVVGECNIQFALDPYTEDYRVIEVNARLSRSSALASKATGYPLAFVAAKLGLGYSLAELENKITKKTKACFEPALDYIVVKMPRWDLKKFKEVDLNLGSEMKSVGEVMSIGRNFEEAIQKACRMVGTGMAGINMNNIEFEDLEKELKHPTDRRIFAVAEAIKKGKTVDEVYELTKIDRWFLYKIKIIIDAENDISEYKNNIDTISREELLQVKALGFSDIQIALITDTSEKKIRELRKKLNIRPCIKQIDTLAAEYPAKTNYLYLTYNGSEDDVERAGNSIIVLGSGSYRIGSSVEFDWCCVNAIYTANNKGYNTIMVNFNPETVSTDYDICNRLFFDEISLESILDIYEFENPEGIIISMGGQIPNNLAVKLDEEKVKVLGTSPKDIDMAESRHKFSKLLDDNGIDQPEWNELTNIEDAKKFANKVGYPVLIRPSYVLSGAAMNVVWDDESLEKYLEEASNINPLHPVVITKFIEKSKEIEVDAVANKGKVVIYAMSEHVENAGVHSGDATVMLPAQKLYIETIRKIKRIVRKIAEALNITGPFNIQFLAYKNKVRVIECNLRSSRSFPFCSKVLKINMIDIATRAILGEDVNEYNKSHFDLDYVGIKAAQFSFPRLKGVDPLVGVEMSSTGEVGCIGNEISDAMLKSLESIGLKIPEKGVLLSTGPVESKVEFLESTKKLIELGYKIYATHGTAEFLKENALSNVVEVKFPNDKTNEGEITAKDCITEKMVDLVINIPKSNKKTELSNGYVIRRTAVDYGLSLITDIKVAVGFVDAIEYKMKKGIEIKSWDEY